MAHNRVAVVAGVGPGIGIRFVEIFAQEGYRVVALARNADALARLRSGLGQWLSAVYFGRLTSRTTHKSNKPLPVSATNSVQSIC